jgi:hypothetical protein
MDLEGARALAYEGSAWEMIEVAAVEEDWVVWNYLLGHAKETMGAGAQRVLSVEALVPWRELEVWALGLGGFPFAPPLGEPGGQRRGEVKAWLDSLAGVPLDCDEWRWRMLLCGLVWCRNLEEMEKIGKALGTVEKPVDDYYRWVCVGDDHLRIGLRDKWISRNLKWTIFGEDVVKVAQGMGIEPPARVIAGLGG